MPTLNILEQYANFRYFRDILDIQVSFILRPGSPTHLYLYKKANYKFGLWWMKICRHISAMIEVDVEHNLPKLYRIFMTLNLKHGFGS